MSLLCVHPIIISGFIATSSFRPLSSKSNNLNRQLIFSKQLFSSFSFSTTSTFHALQYDMITNTPTQSQPTSTRRRLSQLDSSNSPEEENPGTELGFDSRVEKKLTLDDEMDKSKRKYYKKRRKRMYGSDSEDDEKGKNEDGFVELEPKVVEFDRLHEREEELYFNDTLAYPLEKERHYKMDYQLEKKYFPEQCFDKAFLEPGESNEKIKVKGRSKKPCADKEVKDKRLVFFEEEGNSGKDVKEEVIEKKVKDKRLVFFEEEGNSGKDVKEEVIEKKVKFFKCSKKVPSKDTEVSAGEPYLVSRSTGLPPRWDGPYGTVVLVNKPKRWTSFTVCGKLRRLVKVKKLGHAGTLDPMATGLLIVCVGKATKLVERYQGMIKGYSGVFRLGEATSTWDADSPVIQRDPWEHIKDQDIKKTAASFCGDIWQVPPMFSAIKVGGEKMYEKARRGESVELPPRQISIFHFDIERSLDDRRDLIFRVTCSKGTYIRSLCADFGKALGSCAHLTALRRDSIGEYAADDAWEFKELEEAITKGYF